MQVLARAKINLCLHVTGQRADGYHMLDSVVAFADVGDRVTWQAADGLALQVAGPQAAGVPTDGRNLILKAAQMVPGAQGQFHLEKVLPPASGIGGGSADAVAALRCLERAGFETPDQGDLTALGADVPVCWFGQACRMQGVGERLRAIPLPPLGAVLINPGVEVPTPQVFAGLAQKTNPPLPDRLPTWASPEEVIDWLAAQTRNDLAAPALARALVISRVLAALDQVAPFARMSGSGATCFGLFPTAAQARQAAADLTQAHPEWWVMPTILS